MPVSSISSVRSGSSGSDVRELQRALKDKGFDPQGADGKFGANTRKAVVAFQKANGLEPDGVVGKDTRKALFGSPSQSPPVRPSDPVDVLSGKANYEAKYGKQIEFRVVDTGGAFVGKGTSRIDICTANERASVDPTINGKLTLVRQ